MYYFHVLLFLFYFAFETFAELNDIQKIISHLKGKYDTLTLPPNSCKLGVLTIKTKNTSRNILRIFQLRRNLTRQLSRKWES